MPFVIQQVREDPVPGAELSHTAILQFVERDVLAIGRAANADLRFTEASVALAHASLRVLAGGGVEVVDEGSVTGTYVNGKPVERAVLSTRDWVEIGRHRVTVKLGEPGQPHVLYVRELELEQERAAPVEAARTAAGDAATIRPPTIDYVAAYGLRRRLLGRASLSVTAALAGVIAIVWLVAAGRSDVFRPGAVSRAHSGFGADCAACHLPWRGAGDERCATCHAGPEHQPREVEPPGCRECHVEHRAVALLKQVGDARCIACHRELRVSEGEPEFALKVTDFAVDHPEFALPVATEDGSWRRLRLDETPAARQSDPGKLWLSHAVHLRPDLKGPDGPEQLDCLGCHAPDRARDVIVAVNYERHCQRCHRLVFDPRLPDAPHTSPEKLHAFLLRVYVEREAVAAGGAARPAPLRTQRRLLPRGGGREDAAPTAGLPQLDVEPRVLRQVIEAELNLHRSACAKCHEVDVGTLPPSITPIAIPRRWFDYAKFSHQRHRLLACTFCHRDVERSKETHDVLLPGIAVCRQCHGGEATVGAAPLDRDDDAGGELDGPVPPDLVRPGATTQCVVCHAYHDASRTGEWSRSEIGAWESDSGFVGVAAETTDGPSAAGGALGPDS